MRLLIFFFCLSVIAFSCSFSQKIKSGESAFERKQYAVAVDILSEEYNEANNKNTKAYKALLLGKSYIKLLEYDEAEKWFYSSFDLNQSAEALGNLAQTYKTLEKYDLAIQSYQKLSDITGRVQENQREILICKQAKDAKLTKSEFIINPLFNNTSTSEYAPVLYEGDFLVFTSERIEATGKDIYKWSGEKYSDLFVMLKTGSEIRKFDSAINTQANEGTACFSKDFDRVYFTRCQSFTSGGDDFCKLMVSQRENGIWNEPEMLPFIQEKINYGQPTLIEKDSILVFVADILEPGGPTDLYYAELFSDGTWSAPEKMPNTINSQGNEKFPTADGDTLYFSSDYLPGLGGYDIFKTFLKDDGSWSFPISVGYPINSGADDFSFLVDRSKPMSAGIYRKGFFTSSRKGTGKDDIYTFTQLMPTKKEDQPTDPKKKDEKIYLAVRSFTNQYEITENPNSPIVGKNILPNAYVKAVINANEKLFDGYTDKNGLLLVEIAKDLNIKLQVSKLEYLNATKNVSSSGIVFDQNQNTYTINEELILDKIFKDVEINLQNIYYDYDKWDIKEEAKPTLAQLVKLLNDNPQIKIQLSSHTDCRGEEDYNQVLSQKRAESVVNYLINAGIDNNRLEAKGYGESLLVDNCICDTCTEEQHQVNRRTTFKILGR